LEEDGRIMMWKEQYGEVEDEMERSIKCADVSEKDVERRSVVVRVIVILHPVLITRMHAYTYVTVGFLDQSACRLFGTAL
jgi:hypothetical protein